VREMTDRPPLITVMISSRSTRFTGKQTDCGPRARGRAFDRWSCGARSKGSTLRVRVYCHAVEVRRLVTCWTIATAVPYPRASEAKRLSHRGCGESSPQSLTLLSEGTVVTVRCKMRSIVCAPKSR
jgi:hypothetical protein